MTLLIVLAVFLTLVAVGAFVMKRKLDGMTKKEKKRFLKSTLNGVFVRAEERGWLPRTPAFNHDYLETYPSLRILEDGYDVVREECLRLLEIKDKLTDMSAMGGSYTQAGIHTAKWKTFMFKSGQMVEQNCRLAPRTADLIRQIPEAYTAFFSILDPHQHVVPHWGYYKGFVRYHLGVLIPNNNEDRKCFLRVNGDAADNARHDTSLIDKSEVYYWHDGEGIVFDDNYLHDAENASDEVRVVLWMDLRRPMPWPIQLFNRLCLFFVHRDESVKKIRDNAIVEV